MSEPASWLARVLALNRTVAVVLLAVLFFGLGEQLWSQFMPTYLDARSKEAARDAVAAGEVAWSALWAVGAYACLRNLFEGFCYVGGGQLTARLGDRGSLLLFGGLTLCGYGLFLTLGGQWAAVLAALLILGWEPLSVPVTFTTVGSTVGEKSRGMAFAVQSIQKRLPKIIGPFIAGRVLGWATRQEGDAVAGQVVGMRLLIIGAMALGVVSVLIQLVWMPKTKPVPPGPSSWQVLRTLHPTLRGLLAAEVFTRWCDWLVREFVILYAVFIRGVSWEGVGDLIALQNLVALLTYLPVGQLTRRTGLRPFVGVTFVFFALFPLTLAVTPTEWMPLAFVVYGLREIGEPARKALITSLLPEEARARGVGLYWGIRSFAICSASLVGAAVWIGAGPQALLVTAFVLGCVGAGVYYLLVSRRPAAAVP